MIVYEHRSQRLLPVRKFASRVFNHFVAAIVIVVLALAAGTLGYRFLGDLPWVDALLNAAMILGGMGPVNALPSTAAKLFAAAYALFAGLVFIGVLGIVLAPFLHRLMHRLHLEAAGREE